MATCIESVKRNVKDTVKRLLEHIPSMEIAIIAHGDYCDENSTYLLKKVDFTRDPAVICNFVTNVGHTGGGDFDEAYEYVMRIARTDFTWRENTNKGFVLIGDATPHLPSYKQNTLKIDWKEEVKLLRDNGIKIYAVRCLNWNEAKHFYKELASLTCGHYLELSQFQANPSWLIAISYREAGDYERLEQFEEEIMGRSGTMNRNFHQLFSTLAGGQNAFEEENSNQDHENDNELNPVDPGRFQVLDVNDKISIQAFVDKMGARFRRGLGFYEWIKPEEVQDNKQIVIMDKETGDMWSGGQARKLAKVPPHQKKKKYTPPANDKYSIFIQSTSYNRVLVPPQRFLYEVDKI